MQWWSFFTGSKPRVQVTLKNTVEQERRLVLNNLRFNTPAGADRRQHVELSFQPLGERTLLLEAEWLASTGTHGFGATLDYLQVHNDVDFVAFDMKSTDTLFLVLVALVGSAIITISGSVGGGLLVGHILKDDSPTSVIVVEPVSIATPDIGPASQSEIDNNEP